MGELPTYEFELKIRGDWLDISHVEEAIYKECKSLNQDVIVQHDMKRVYVKAVQDKNVMLKIIDDVRQNFPKDLIGDTIKVKHDVIG